MFKIIVPFLNSPIQIRKIKKGAAASSIVVSDSGFKLISILLTAENIYENSKVCVNILPQYLELLYAKSLEKIKNVHHSTNFSRSISIVYINYGSPCWT